MDRITKSLLKEFVDENGFHNFSESQQFEHFSCYLLTSRHFTDSFSTEDVCVGDTGIDGISIIVNGSFVSEPEEVEDLCETNGYLDVTIVFVQAETSSSFDSSKIGQFGFGVVDFFNEQPALPRNNDIEQKGRVLNEIYARSSKFKRGNPSCYLYYVTTGKWVDDQNLTVRKQSVESDLNSLGILRNVSFKCIDTTDIQTFYRDSKNSISCEILFPECTVLPEITGVQQAYIGVLSASEYLKLIQNIDEEIIHSLFYDNVRHWQEWNPVNKEIRETLLDPSQQEYFPIFNNGATIVARSIKPTGSKYLLEDYQIVNGCQTSYVLFESKNFINDNVRIPVRLIATDNQDIKNAIIKATNRQTQVSDEQLIVLTDFSRKLEDFFPSFEGKKRLYYERRSRQYNSVDGVEKVRVINMTDLVRVFASIFLDLPHRTTRNYKALLKSIGTDIFNSDHKLEPYYVAAFTHYRLEYLFRSQIIERELKAARYHLQMCFRYLASESPMPRHFNSKKMQHYCEGLLSIIWDDEKYKELFKQSVETLKNAADGNLHRDNIRTEPFTKKLIEKVKNEIEFNRKNGRTPHF